MENMEIKELRREIEMKQNTISKNMEIIVTLH